MKLRDKITRFMYGRYGTDTLNKDLTWLYIGLIVIGWLLSKNGIVKTVFLFVELALIGFVLFRSFSKNIYARSTENRKYTVFRNKIIGFFKLQKSRWKDRKTHVYKKCPHCKAVLRLPKKRGNHRVDCPKCKNEFKVKIK